LPFAAQGKRCLVSGSGNVAQFAAEKLLELGAVVLTLSDSSGTWLEPNGFTPQVLQQIMDLKNIRRGRLSDFSSPTGSYHAGVKPWALVEAADIALPCATQVRVTLDQQPMAALAQLMQPPVCAT
jgi:glutamate dehydrogenase (NADP+)